MTNSYSAARFPVDLSEGDTSGPIPVDALKASRKNPGGRYLRTDIVADGDIRVREIAADDVPSEPYLMMPRESGDYQFPNLAQLTPEHAAEFEIGVDAKLLYDLAKAMGESRVRLTFTAGRTDHLPDPTRPDPMRIIQVRPLGGGEDDPSGLLMPIRLA